MAQGLFLRLRRRAAVWRLYRFLYPQNCRLPLAPHGKRGYCRKLPEKENSEGNPRLLSGEGLLEGTGLHTGRVSISI